MGLRRWVVGLVVAVAVSVATFTGGPAPTAGADGCPDVQLIFARGTAEPPGMGRVGDALFAALQPALGSRSVEAYAVNYPATITF
jgi:cutinase